MSRRRSFSLILTHREFALLLMKFHSQGIGSFIILQELVIGPLIQIKKISCMYLLLLLFLLFNIYYIILLLLYYIYFYSIYVFTSLFILFYFIFIAY
jgi:hypothetical protein